MCGWKKQQFPFLSTKTGQQHSINFFFFRYDKKKLMDNIEKKKKNLQNELNFKQIHETNKSFEPIRATV